MVTEPQVKLGWKTRAEMGLADAVDGASKWVRAVDWGSIFVGAFAVFVAIALWALWLFWGSQFVKEQMSPAGGASVQPLSGAASAAGPQSVASAVFSSAASAPAGVQVFVTVPQPLAAFPEPPSKLTELGQAGDAFGSANALFAAIAGGLLVWSGWLQRRALIEARVVNQKQQFETTFFELLSMGRELEGRFRKADVSGKADRADPSPALQGHEALSDWALELDRRVQASVSLQDKSAIVLARIVTDFHDHVYDKDPGAFGPYFRVLYQTFKHVASSTLSREEKIQYANIARGQINEDAVFLLAANGLGNFGEKFIRLINRFGLLEHMNRTYRDRHQAAFLLAYQPSAFQGSEDRKARRGNVRESPKSRWYQPAKTPADSAGGPEVGVGSQ